MRDLFFQHDATEIARMVQTSELSAQDVLEESISNCEASHPSLNAIAQRLYDQARAIASRVDRTAPMAGVPVAMKDLYVSMRGVPIHAGSRLAPNVGQHDSLLVQRYLRAGMVPVVTSTTPEWGLSLMTESARFGVTRNPWNPKHTTGGSSGGASALVAAGAVPVAHASDAGGSIRVPAACTGLVGLKPSRGRVPLTPDQSEGLFGTVVQHALTRSVRDSALMLDISCGPDPISPYTAEPPSTTFAQAAQNPESGRRLAVYRGSPLGLDISDETLAALTVAQDACREAGHTVEEIDLPMIDRSFVTAFAQLIAAGFAGRMAEKAETLGRSPLPRLERKTRLVARFGNVLPAGHVAALLNKLQAKSRALLTHTLPYDAVLMPLIAHPPLPCGAMTATGVNAILEQILDHSRLTHLLRIPQFLDRMVDQSMWFTHWPAIQNVSGQPAIALPVHITAQGLPLGVQAVGRMGDEATLLSIAAQLEDIVGWRGKHP